jgi:hypothetical protein
MYKTGASDTLVVFGPTRYDAGWSLPYNRWVYDSRIESATVTRPRYISNDKWEASPYTLLTQDGLSADSTGRTYRYMVGTYAEDDNLMLDIRLYSYDVVNNQDKELVYNIHFDPEFKVDQFEAGNIIAYAPVKDNKANSEFIVSKPYDGVELIYDQNAKRNDDGSITLAGAYPPNSNPGTLTHKNAASGILGYVALKGAYGVGYYTDYYFTGNNMPYVVMFADRINADISKNGGKGIVLLNGMVTQNSESGHNYKDVFKVTKENRVEGAYAEFLTTSNSLNELSMFVQSALNSETNYKYTVGSFINNGEVCISLALHDLDSNKAVSSVSFTTGLTVSQLPGTNIIALGAMKGVDTNQVPYTTTFKMSTPYYDKSVGNVAKNADGSITMAGVYPSNPNPGTLTALTNLGYYSSNEKVGLNKFVDIEFVGNNMPHITFFADTINYDLSTNGGKGIVLINGIKQKADSGEPRTTDLCVYGPNRIDGRYSYDARETGSVLAQDNLVDNTKYKLTIGTVEKAGNIYIVYSLYNESTKITVAENVEINTNITVDAMKTALNITNGELEGYLVFYGAMKGVDGDQNPLDTTFKLLKIYNK